MEKRISLLFSLLVLLSLAACSGKEEGGTVDSFWADKPVIAEKRVVDGDTVIVCDVGKIMSKVDLPFEVIATDYRMVPLENDRDEALLSNALANMVVSDHYMGFHCYSRFPFKLFTRTGEYLRDVGGIGQGPGEYQTLSFAQLDEANNRIYLLPWNSAAIHAYDLEGNYLSDIPLPHRVPTGVFKVYPERGEVVVANILLRGSQHFVWKQDLEGNILSEVSPEGFFTEFDSFDNSIMSGLHGDAFDLYYFIYLKEKDNYLYHYDEANNRLVPKFVVENFGKSAFVYELPSCYIVESTHSTTGKDNMLDMEGEKILVDKKTLKGCYITGVRMPFGLVFGQYCLFSRMTNGNFSINEFGSNLLELLELQGQDDLTLAERAELDKIVKLIEAEEDDCMFAFTGKLRD